MITCSLLAVVAVAFNISEAPNTSVELCPPIPCIVALAPTNAFFKNWNVSLPFTIVSEILSSLLLSSHIMIDLTITVVPLATVINAVALVVVKSTLEFL